MLACLQRTQNAPGQHLACPSKSLELRKCEWHALCAAPAPALPLPLPPRVHGTLLDTYSSSCLGPFQGSSQARKRIQHIHPPRLCSGRPVFP
ncbi:hypothetical protein CB1_000701001 [Camelus ferus]|nr:hypothetical protein CB1_002630014 [Camelus ferus]EPY81843.1 hypothetical protein CB1_000701001 [Camelus ferus]